jgi:tetratricopeptide (TPR) repeat protein
VTAPLPPVPERAAQQYAQALTLMKSGRNTDAELEFKQLALAYPDFAGPNLNLGLLYLRASRYGDAEVALKAALARSPDNAIANDELGITERKLGKFAEAEAAYQHAIAVEPNYAPAYLNLGVLYDLYLVQPQKALEQFEHYLTLAGDNKQVAGWVVELKKRVPRPPRRRSLHEPASKIVDPGARGARRAVLCLRASRRAPCNISVTTRRLGLRRRALQAIQRPERGG